MAVYQWFLSALKKPTHMQSCHWMQLSTALLFWRAARYWNWASEHQHAQASKQTLVSTWRFPEEELPCMLCLIPFVQKPHTAKVCMDTAPICKFFLGRDGPPSRVISASLRVQANKQRDIPSHPKKPRNSNSVCKGSQASITIELSYKIQRLYKEKLPDISWCNSNSPQVKNKFRCCDIPVEAWLDTCLAQHCWFLWKVNWRTKGYWNVKKFSILHISASGKNRSQAWLVADITCCRNF